MIIKTPYSTHTRAAGTFDDVKMLIIFWSTSSEAVHKRRRQLGGVKNWSKLLTDSTKKTANMGEGGVKNPEKLSTLFMDGP